MNERIKELADQVGAVLNVLAMGRHDGVLFTETELEKFAELIIRECIDKIQNYDLVPGHSAKWEDIYDIHARLLDDLGEELKEHFGIQG